MSGFLKSNVSNNALAPALLSPKSYGDVVGQNITNHFNYNHTIGTFLKEGQIGSDFVDDFNTTFPDANLSNPVDNVNEGFVNFQGVSIEPSYQYKLNKMKKDVAKYLDALPDDDERKTTYKTYDTYKEELLAEMQQSEYVTSLYSKYQQGGSIKKFTAPMVGMSIPAIVDPMFMMTMPLTLFSGGATVPAFLLREAAIGAGMGIIGQTGVESKVYPFKKRLGEDNYTLKTVAANIGMVTAGGAVLGPVLAGAIRYGFIPAVSSVFGKAPAAKEIKLGLKNMTENVQKLDVDIQAKIFDAEYAKLAAAGDDIATVNYIGKKINELSEIDAARMTETLHPDTYAKLKEEGIIEEIKSKKALEIENIYPETAAGKKAHFDNQLEAQKALLLDEEMKLVETDLPIQVTAERQQIRNKNLEIANTIIKNNQDTGLSTIVEAQKAVDDYLKNKTDEEFLNQFDNPDDIAIFGKTADDQFETHAAENPDYMYAVGEALDADGNPTTITKSAEELKADVTNDANIIRRLKDCV